MWRHNCLFICRLLALCRELDQTKILISRLRDLSRPRLERHPRSSWHTKIEPTSSVPREECRIYLNKQSSVLAQWTTMWMDDPTCFAAFAETFQEWSYLIARFACECSETFGNDRKRSTICSVNYCRTTTWNLLKMFWFKAQNLTRNLTFV